jgi:inner membrane protein
MNGSMLKSSIILRMFIIAGLTLLLLVPALFVESLISERRSRREDATLEVSRSWGAIQTLTGPVLTIPYKEFSTDEKGIVSYTVRHAHFLPSRLLIRGSLQPEIRYRGIYEVPLYQAKFEVEGEFSRPDLAALQISSADALWENAVVTFGISDLKGIRDTVSLRWDGAAYRSEPGVVTNDVVPAGITFRPRLDPGRPSVPFDIPLSLNGSSEIRFVPGGETTEATLEAPWGNPSFVGSFLPLSREVTPDSFRAVWKVFNLNRNFPQAWTGDKYDVASSSFGASLYVPVDEYQKTSRSVKYALLFIALTFVAFFLSEVIARTAFHPIQYTLIGLALVLFYVLLLSLTEHMRFNLAYVIASGGVVCLITIYAAWISSKWQIAAVVFGVLVALYGFLFVTLQLQDYALLLGGVGLFVALSLIMFLTRKIDWFAVNRQ